MPGFPPKGGLNAATCIQKSEQGKGKVALLRGTGVEKTTSVKRCKSRLS